MLPPSYRTPLLIFSYYWASSSPLCITSCQLKFCGYEGDAHSHQHGLLYCQTLSLRWFLVKISKTDDAEEAMLEMYCEGSQLKRRSRCSWSWMRLLGRSVYTLPTKAEKLISMSRFGMVLEHQIVEKMLADIHSFELEPSHDCIFSIGIFEWMNSQQDIKVDERRCPPFCWA